MHKSVMAAEKNGKRKHYHQPHELLPHEKQEYLSILDPNLEEKIITILRESSASGDTTGKVGEGFCYMFGIGTRVNVTKAGEIFKK